MIPKFLGTLVEADLAKAFDDPNAHCFQIELDKAKSIIVGIGKNAGVPRFEVMVEITMGEGFEYVYFPLPQSEDDLRLSIISIAARNGRESVAEALEPEVA